MNDTATAGCRERRATVHRDEQLRDGMILDGQGRCRDGTVQGRYRDGTGWYRTLQNGQNGTFWDGTKAVVRCRGSAGTVHGRCNTLYEGKDRYRPVQVGTDRYM